jgi:hypothetical protein
MVSSTVGLVDVPELLAREFDESTVLNNADTSLCGISTSELCKAFLKS